MESFRAAVDRLSKILVSDLLAAVRAAAVEQLALQQKKEARPKPTRILRPPSAAAVEAARAVVVRQFDIPVGQPRRPRRRSSGAPACPQGRAAPAAAAGGEVRSRAAPDRKNRRIVMTRLDNA